MFNFEFLKIKKSKNKILYTLVILFIYRLGTHIPIPGVDLDQINNLFSNNNVLRFF